MPCFADDHFVHTVIVVSTFNMFSLNTKRVCVNEYKAVNSVSFVGQVYFSAKTFKAPGNSNVVVWWARRKVVLPSLLNDNGVAYFFMWQQNISAFIVVFLNLSTGKKSQVG